MSDDEQVLASFCDGDERLRETWTVTAVERGRPRKPPQAGGDLTLGLTDRRLLWFDEELGSVALAALEGVEPGVTRHRSAPRIVRLGSVAMMLGLLTTVTATVLSLASLPTALLPVIAGVFAFAGALVYARATGQSGSERSQHRLRIDDGGEPVTVWADEATSEAIATALDGSRGSEDGSTEAA